ncbi:MAG: TetR-like C-terminal domain-containing protein, partial [Clostridium sp.]
MNELFKILDYMKNNKDIFKVLLNGYGSLLFVEKLKRAITEKFTDDFIGRMPNIDKKYYTA